MGGEIDNMELTELLQEFGWQPKSKAAQGELMKKLDVARALAREAGIQDVGEDGSPCIKFWSFVQLARMQKRKSSGRQEVRLWRPGVPLCSLNRSSWALRTSLGSPATGCDAFSGPLASASPLLPPALWRKGLNL